MSNGAVATERRRAQVVEAQSECDSRVCNLDEFLGNDDPLTCRLSRSRKIWMCVNVCNLCVYLFLCMRAHAHSRCVCASVHA